MNKVEQLCVELEKTVTDAYENGVSLEDAERLAAKMLSAQMTIARELEAVDLDSRMRKNGVKAIKAAVYMEEINKYDKKPAEGLLEHAINQNKLVNTEQDAYETLDARKSALTIYLGIFKESHIYFRSIMKGTFSG